MSLSSLLIAASGVGLPIPPGLIAFNSTEGKRLLMEAVAAETAAPYFDVIAHVETQTTPRFCGAATAAAALNALSTVGVPSPTTYEHIPYGYHRQWSVLGGDCVSKVAVREQDPAFGTSFVATHGTTLDQERDMLRCWADADKMHAEDADVEQFRRDVVNVTTGESVTRVMALNWKRSELGQEGGGHFSPVGAYHAGRDMLLIVDVARYKYPQVWVPLPQVFAAMNTTDTSSNRSRGWLVVQRALREIEMPPPAQNPADYQPINDCLLAADNDWAALVSCYNVSKYTNFV